MPVISPTRGSIGIFFKGDPALAGYWQLHNNSLDASGRNRHAVNNGIIFTSVGFRSGIKSGYSSGNKYIEAPSGTAPTGNSARTFLAWIWFKGTTSNYVTIMGNGANGTANDFSFLLSNENPNTRLYLRRYYDDQRSSVLHSVEEFRIKWRLVGVVYPGTVSGDIFFVFDDKFEPRDASYSSGGVTFNTANTVFRVFATPTIGANFLGYISEAAVFSRALTKQEILEYYRWATSYPKKYWYFLSLATTLNSQLSFATNLKTTERINPITSFNFSNAQTSFKETIRQMTSFNFSGSATTTLGRIVQGVIRRIINPKGGGIIKNR